MSVADPVDGGDVEPGAPKDPASKRMRPITVVAIVLGTVLAVIGLLFVAFIVVFMVALSQWGSNK